MTRYLLDTNIISNVTQPNPSPSLLEWMSEQADTDLFISALTVAEIQRGLLQKPAGKKRSALETVDLLRNAAAQGQAKGDQMDNVQAPGREPPERDRSIVKPFEIGI